MSSSDEKQPISKELINALARHKLVSNLSNGLSHDLSNSLLYIMGNNNRIQSKFDKSESLTKQDVEKYLGAIAEAVDMMKDRLKHANLFAKAKAVTLETIDLKNIIQNLKIQTKHKLQTSDIYLEIEEHAATDFLVSTDKYQLEEALHYLIDNAKESIIMLNPSPDHLRNIRLTLNPVPDNRVAIEITNYWTSLKNENPSNFLRPYFTTKDPTKHLGIGLNLAHHIVETLNGTLVINSSKEEFSSIIQVPLAT